MTFPPILPQITTIPLFSDWNDLLSQSHIVDAWHLRSELLHAPCIGWLMRVFFNFSPEQTGSP